MNNHTETLFLKETIFSKKAMIFGTTISLEGFFAFAVQMSSDFLTSNFTHSSAVSTFVNNSLCFRQSIPK